MSEAVLLALVGVGGTVIGFVGQILVARFSKPKNQKDVELAEDYLKLADMTAEQLEKKLNKISELDKDLGVLERENRKMTEEVEMMQKARKERDELFGALEARVAALQAQLDKDARDREELRRKFSELDSKYRILWQYMISLVEHMKRHNVSPLDPPKELQTDPELMRIIKGKSNS